VSDVAEEDQEYDQVDGYDEIPIPQADPLVQEQDLDDPSGSLLMPEKPLDGGATASGGTPASPTADAAAPVETHVGRHRR
jgi:hypothetical protein